MYFLGTFELKFNFFFTSTCTSAGLFEVRPRFQTPELDDAVGQRLGTHLYHVFGFVLVSGFFVVVR